MLLAITSLTLRSVALATPTPRLTATALLSRAAVASTVPAPVRVVVDSRGREVDLRDVADEVALGEDSEAEAGVVHLLLARKELDLKGVSYVCVMG